MILTRYGLAASLMLALAACTHNAAPGDWPSREPYEVTTDYLPLSANTKLDLLFMLDNSNGLLPQRSSLIQYFPNLTDALAGHDLHVGIITANLGAGAFTPPSCARLGGDQGMLRAVPLGPTCATAALLDPEARFLAFAPAADGGAPTVNFTGTLADAFACYATMPENGCGFEHQLASIRAALDGCDTPGGCTQAVNEGFLRPDANLAIVIATDEDDCSAPPDSTLFDTTQTTLDSPLGPLTSYRCFEFGNLCDGLDPGRAQGRRSNCVPGNKDPNPLHQLTPVADFAAFLKALKPWPGSLYVAVIAAPPGPIAVGLDANGYPDLQPSCTGAMGGADPAPRLAQFLGLLPPARGRFFSTCQADLSRVLTTIGADLGAPSTCLTGRQRYGLPGIAFNPECVVTDRGPAGEAMLIPPCEPVLCESGGAPTCECVHEIAAGAPGCWYVWSDPVCQFYDPWQQQPLATGLRLAVDRGANGTCTPATAPAGTVTEIQCGTCSAQPREGVFDCSPGCADYWSAACAWSTL